MRKLNRRSLIAGSAALAAAAPAASRSTTGCDPIFAAIEVHRARIVAHGLACEVYGRLNIYDPQVASAPETAALKRAEEAASDELEAAARTLLNVSPTSIAGVVALLRYTNETMDVDGYDTWPDYVVGPDGDEDQAQSWTYLMHARVADALEKVASMAVRS